MVPAPSDPALDPVRHLRIGLVLDDAVTRTHVADGRAVGWYAERGVVIDAEIADQPVPAALEKRFGQGRSPQEFWTLWTQAECAAKLRDVPIVVWLRSHGLGPAGHRVQTLRLDDLVVSVGWPEE